MLILLTIILFLGIGISSFSYLLFYRDLRKTAIQSTETNLELLTENVNDSLDDIISLLYWCQTNDQLTKFLLSQRGSEKYASITSLATDVLNTTFVTNASKNYIQRLVIGSPERSDFLQVVNTNYSVDKPIPELITQLSFFEEHMETPRLEDVRLQMIDEPFTRRSGKIIPIIRPIQNPYTSGSIGFVYLALDISLLTDELGVHTLDEYGELLFCMNGQYYRIADDSIVPSGQTLSLTDYPETYQVRSDTSVYYTDTASGRSIAVLRPLDLNGCSVVQLIMPEQFRQQFAHYFLLILLIFLLILVIGIIMIAILTRTITHPVELLRNRISLIAGGDFSQDSSILWDSELGDMGQDINQLSSDIQTLINKRLEVENEKQAYEYRLLQSQVNPHFLYNTLNSIKWMATIQNAPGIAEMTTALSGLLKNISKGSSTLVTIRQEFALLEDYFIIQKYRYGGMIQMKFEIEDETLCDNEIPRFSLQPIVENSIFHGIEPKGQPGLIRIHLFAPDDKTVQIDVTDNGTGIEPEKIKTLLTENAGGQGSFFRNIGISNVNKRLQYTYGDRFGLKITSETGSYTTVSVLLPHKLIKEENYNAETSDC